MAAECDVWMSRDKQVIVCHDETLKRTAVSHSNLLDQPILSLDYDQLKKILVGNEQHAEPVPLLKDLLVIIPDGKKLLVEIKFKDLNLLKYFIDCIRSYLDKMIVISFYPDVLAELKKLLPECKIILLTTAKRYTEETVIVNDEQSLQKTLSLVNQHHLDGLGFEYSDFIKCGSGVVRQIPGSLLTHLWYSERNSETVKSIIEVAAKEEINFINLDYEQDQL